MEEVSDRVHAEISVQITSMNTDVKVYRFEVRENENETPKSLPELSDLDSCHRQPSTYGIKHPFFKIIEGKYIIIVAKDCTNVLLKISLDGNYEQFVGNCHINLETGEGKYSSEIVDEASFQADLIEEI